MGIHVVMKIANYPPHSCPPVYPSVHPFVINAAPTGHVTFYIGNFMKICQEFPNLIQIWKKYQALYVKTYVCPSLPCNIKSP